MKDTVETESTEVAIAPEPVNAPPADLAMIQMIERVALNPDVDIEKMRAVLDMRTEMMDRDAEVAFSAAMSDVQSEMRPVVAESTNDQTRSKYAKLDAIAKAIDPIISKHGFSKSFGQGETDKQNHYRVTMELRHRAGFKKNYFLDIPIDAAGMAGKINKTATHALGSTMSYGRRYIKLMAFDIATGDDDDGNSVSAGSGETITAEQFQTLRGKIEDAEADESKFLKFFKVTELHELPMAAFGKADAMLDQKVAAHAAKVEADA